MKKNLFSLPVVLSAFLLAIILFSCSKDKESLNPTSANTAQAALEADPDGKIIMRGSIAGMISPRSAEIAITVYSPHFETKSFNRTKDGGFRVDRIPPGFYTVDIVNVNTFENYSFTDVKVAIGYVTNIGLVKF